MSQASIRARRWIGFSAGAGAIALLAFSLRGLPERGEDAMAQPVASQSPRPGDTSPSATAAAASRSAASVTLGKRSIGAASAEDKAYRLRETERTMRPSLRELGRAFEAEGPSSIEFPLFDGASVELTGLRHVRTGADAGVFTGRVGDDPLSHVVLSYMGEAEAGTIHYPSQNVYYDIRSGAGGATSYLAEVDPSLFPPCGACAPGAPQVHQ